jgi:tetratricopeptide (TPR) repeat protein
MVTDRARFLTGGLMLAASLVVTTSAVAQTAAPATTDAREQEARAACAAGRVDEGVKILADLLAQTEDMTYVFNQGRCFQQNGRPKEALTRFREFLRRAGSADADAKKEAEGFAAELESEIATDEARGAKIAAEAGDGGRTLRLTGMALGAGGVAAVLVGLGLSLKVRSQKQETEAYARRTDLDFAELDRKIAAGNRYEAWQWPAYLLGAAALIGGGTCYWIGHTRIPTEQVSLTALVTPSEVRGSMEFRF